MPDYFTKEYVANLAVRNFLSEEGRKKWPETINQTQWRKMLKKFWGEIKRAFDYRCVYCGAEKGSKKRGKEVKLERDHLIPINKEACGLNHPGNIVPSCQTCNNKHHKLEWEEKLRKICVERRERSLRTRRLKIISHPYKYPRIKASETETLRKHAQQLYTRVIEEISRANNQR